MLLLLHKPGDTARKLMNNRVMNISNADVFHNIVVNLWNKLPERETSVVPA